MDKELWKNVPNYNGRYQASTWGRIRSTPRISYRGTTKLHLKGKVLSPGKTPRGYLLLHLYTDGKPVKYYVQQLVAKTFIPNPHGLKETSHKDEDKENNRPDNLEWCTREFNINYGHRSQKAGISSGHAVSLYKHGNYHDFTSMTSAASWLIAQGYSKLTNPKQMVSTISACAKHKPNHKHVFGFTVEFTGKRHTEIWRDIPGYSGLYQASNYGRIRRKAHYAYIKRYMPSRILKPTEDKDGYYRVGLYRKRHQNMHRINQLVARTFISNPNGYPAVNHRNEDRKDNRPQNLEWCSTLYNNRYGHRSENIIKKNGHALTLSKNGKKYKFPTLISAVRWLKRKYGIQCTDHGMRNNLRLCLRHAYGHQNWYGYQPKFVDDTWIQLPISELDA